MRKGGGGAGAGFPVHSLKHKVPDPHSYGVDETGWQNQRTPDIGRLINCSPFISQIRDKIWEGK